MAPRWDLSLLQFIVKRVVIIREDQTILERQVMMREKDLCVFHTADFTIKMSNLLTTVIFAHMNCVLSVQRSSLKTILPWRCSSSFLPMASIFR